MTKFYQEIIYEAGIVPAYEKLLNLSPSDMDKIMEQVNKIYETSPNKNLYKDIPDVTAAEAEALGKKAIYDEIIKELGNQKAYKILKESDECAKALSDLIANNKEIPADDIMNLLKKFDPDGTFKPSESLDDFINKEKFNKKIQDAIKNDVQVKGVLGKEYSINEIPNRIKVSAKDTFRNIKGTGGILLGIGFIYGVVIDVKTNDKNVIELMLLK